MSFCIFNLQPMALYDRKEGDAEELAKIVQFNKATKEMIIDSVVEDTSTVNQMFIQNPELNNTLAKMLLVDSKGQHKDQRNAKRLQSAQKLLEKQEKKEQKEIEKTWSDEQTDYLTQKIDFSKYLQNE